VTRRPRPTSRIRILIAVLAAIAVTLLLPAAAEARQPNAASTTASNAASKAAAATCSQAFLPLPDPVCTPGVTYSVVTQGTINSTICVSGWTATVRPPTSYTGPLKIQQIAAYGYSDTNTSDYEEDHFIPLELGGSPRDPKNLWPEPHAAIGGHTSSQKDGVETQLKNLVCKGQVTLVAAQNAIATNWTTAIAVVTGGGGGGGTSVTVANPGSQTGTVGTAASLQIAASDSAGRALTYSTTGLPAGLSIDPGTGLIAGTPSAAGTSTVTVTAGDSTGASGSASFSWTVSAPSGGTCTPAQLLGNAGFESGTAAPWTTTARIDSSSAESPNSGSYDAWLDGYGATHTDTLAQTLTLPTGCTAYTFSFWLHVDTAETTTTRVYDKLTVQIQDASGTVLATPATYSNLDANSGYAQHSFDLSAYAGQSVTVEFTGAEDYTQQTSFVLDDTALSTS
jgi:hypothetical protein